MEPKIGMDTPWGRADAVHKITDGIYQVSTPSHGGLWVSQERRATMPPPVLAKSRFYDGGPFFEEDCEWSRVAVCFPDAFPGAAADANLIIEQVHPGMLAQCGF